MNAPTLELALERFGEDLLEAARREQRRRPRLPYGRRRLVLAVALVAAIAVPGALGAFGGLFGNDHPRGPFPSGLRLPTRVGQPVEFASGTIATGTWHAYVVGCRTGGVTKPLVVVVTPSGSRSGATCRPQPSQVHIGRARLRAATLYDRDSRTTFVYGTGPASARQVRLELQPAGARTARTTPISGPYAQELGPLAAFVIAVRGDQRLLR